MKLMSALRVVAAIVLISLATVANSEQLIGKVIGVSDGDTITILTSLKQKVKIRLAEIDAPEKNQPWGQASKQFLSDLIFSLEVTVDTVGQDRYKRTLGIVFLRDVNINKFIVEHGNAWAYKGYVKDESYFALQNNAQNRKLGLWGLSEKQIIAPWLWRKQKN